MSLFNFFIHPLQNKDWRIRQKAVRTLADNKILVEIAKTDPDWHVRQSAVERISDEQTLVSIARNDKDSDIRACAVEKISNREILEAILNNDTDKIVRNAAHTKLGHNVSNTLDTISQVKAIDDPPLSDLQNLQEERPSESHDEIPRLFNKVPQRQVIPSITVFDGSNKDRALRKEYSTIAGVAFIAGLAFIQTLTYVGTARLLQLLDISVSNARYWEIAGTVTAITFTIAVVYFFVKTAKYDFLDWRNAYRNSLIGLLYATPFIFLFVFAAFSPDAMLTSYKAHLTKLYHDTGYYSRFLYSIITLCSTFLEEVFFRGIIQKNISKKRTSTTAVLLTTLLFVVIHMPQWGSSLPLIILWGALGLLTGFAYVKTKSLVSSFTVHLICNARMIFLTPFLL